MIDDWTYRPASDRDLPTGKRLRSARREPGLLEQLGGRVYGTLVSAHLKWLEKLTVNGLNHLPAEPPFVLVANHCSHLDTLVLASLFPATLAGKVFPVAAGDTFFKTPLKAALSAGFINALPMWRHAGGRHGIDDLRLRLTENPCGLILFPEGTRSRTGQMGRFKPGLGMLVAGTAVPVIPCHLQGTFEAWPADAAVPKRGQAIRVRIGNPLTFATAENHRDGWTNLTEQVHDAVRTLAAD